MLSRVGVSCPPAPYRRQKKVVPRRTDDELRTSVYPANLAPIAAKLRQRAFQTICNFRFFDAENFFSEKNSDFFSRFSLFSVGFRGARLFLTSNSSSSRFFALDGQIFRSRPRPPRPAHFFFNPPLPQHFCSLDSSPTDLVSPFWFRFA